MSYERIFNQLAQPRNVALAVGLSSSAYFLFGNVGGAYFGVLPMPNQLQGTPTNAVKKWEWFYDIAKFHMAPAAGIAGLTYASAGLLTTDNSVGYALYTAAAAGFAILGWTVQFMLPVNNRLKELSAKSDKVALTQAEEQESEALLAKWKAHHRVRMFLGIVSYTLGLSVFVNAL